jgi:hypothetical protein
VTQTSKRMRSAVMMVLALCLAPAVLGASGLDDNSDFARIAENGFALTVDGDFFADDSRILYPNLQPNLGSTHNSYAWSAAWFQDALWIGTARDVMCFDSEVLLLGPFREPLLGPCPELGRDAPKLSGVQKGEIWRYTPSSLDEAGDWGLSGHWERVFVSPSTNPLIAVFGRLELDAPRDVGYRNMELCDAGDGLERLYVATFGLPANILYYDGSSFVPTSSRGFFTRLGQLALDTADLGFRAMACFKGRLWVSPAGNTKDLDTTQHPILFVNDHPATGGRWKQYLDVSDSGAHPLADPNNLGIFQMEVIGDYLWLVTVNRTTGFELWRGDGSACEAPWEGDGQCTIDWTKVIDNGAGRPWDLRGPRVDNAGATLGVFGDDLYVGASESGANRPTLAELIRVRGAGSVPAAGRDAPHVWELLAGWPRRNYAKPDQRLPGLDNLDCARVGDMSDIAPRSWRGLPQTQLDDDLEADDCLPLLDSGPGLDLAYAGPLSQGKISYLWRFAEHQGELFVGTFDIFSLADPTSRAGFDLLASADGAHWRVVSDDGLGNQANYGARTLLSVPDWGLVVGSANPFTQLLDLQRRPIGGTEIYIGTTAPGPFVPPRAMAGEDRDVVDADGDGKVTVHLWPWPAVDPFTEDGGVSYEWYAGALADDCSDLANLHGDAFVSDRLKPAPQVLPVEGGPYDFTLQAKGADGNLSCDQVRITPVAVAPAS